MRPSAPSPLPIAVNLTRGSILPRKIELLEVNPHWVAGSRRKAWNDARCCSGGERLAIGTMYPGGIPGPGLIFDACVLVVVRRCRGVRCSTCATTCTPSPFVVSLSKWVSRSLDLPVARVVLRAVAGLHYGRPVFGWLAGWLGFWLGGLLLEGKGAAKPKNKKLRR